MVKLKKTDELNQKYQRNMVKIKKKSHSLADCVSSHSQPLIFSYWPHLQ